MIRVSSMLAKNGSGGTQALLMNLYIKILIEKVQFDFSWVQW